jgi:predicted RNase H-like HicB family nuclease
MKLSYPAIFYKCDPDEGEGYTVDVPDLLGCVTEGDTLEEAIFMGIDAASGWIMGELRAGRSIPPPSHLETIIPDEGGFASILPLDLDEYEKKFGLQRIKKNLDIEIPAYLATFAESRNLDISKIAQDALSHLFQSQHAQKVHAP